jgi:phage gpG-like protein|tara:strand:- start:1744 stop:2184 length:441 start_codon:yes stop_codon:yes gene_type:complete
MKANIKIKQSDLNQLNKKLNFFKDFDKKVLSSELGRTALDISRLAKRTVPVDTGGLKNSITAEIQGKTVSVVVNKNYAPYIEFGTGSMVNIDDMVALGIPPSYAMQFKGKGLREVNLPARPFLFSSARIEFNNLLNRLNNRIKKIR